MVVGSSSTESRERESQRGKGAARVCVEQRTAEGERGRKRNGEGGKPAIRTAKLSLARSLSYCVTVKPGCFLAMLCVCSVYSCGLSWETSELLMGEEGSRTFTNNKTDREGWMDVQH